MPRFAADTLDVSRLPAPNAIKVIDYEADLAARMADVKGRLEAAGIPYDLENLETDPIKIDQETGAAFSVLDKAAINNAVRAVMISLATGSDLDQLASFFGVARMVVTPASGSTPAVMETDARFRLRALLGPEAFGAAGPVGAYVFQALTADPLVKDVGVRTVESLVEISGGRMGVERIVEVAILSSEAGNGAASNDLLSTVRARLNQKDIKPLTDVVSVVSAEPIDYTVTATLYVPPGPDPTLVIEQAGIAIEALAADNNKVGRTLYLNAIIAAATVGPVRNTVLASPVANVGNGARQAPRLVAKNLTVATLNE